jgi:hypothetical protein
VKFTATANSRAEATLVTITDVDSAACAGQSLVLGIGVGPDAGPINVFYKDALVVAGTSAYTYALNADFLSNFDAAAGTITGTSMMSPLPVVLFQSVSVNTAIMGPTPPPPPPPDPGPGPDPTATPDPTADPTATPDPTTTPAPTLEAGSVTEEVNGWNNPPNPSSPVVFSQFTLVSRSVADRTLPRRYVWPASRSIGDSPRADRRVKGRWEPVYRVGQVVRLVAIVPANTTYRMQYRPPDGRYVDVGQATSDAAGEMSLPVFRSARTGMYVGAMTDVATGRTYYVRVSIGPRRT